MSSRCSGFYRVIKDEEVSGGLGFSAGWRSGKKLQDIQYPHKYSVSKSSLLSK